MKMNVPLIHNRTRAFIAGFVAALVCMVLLGALAGCGGGGSDKDDDDPDPPRNGCDVQPRPLKCL